MRIVWALLIFLNFLVVDGLFGFLFGWCRRVNFFLKIKSKEKSISFLLEIIIVFYKESVYLYIFYSYIFNGMLCF